MASAVRPAGVGAVSPQVLTASMPLHLGRAPVGRSGAAISSRSCRSVIFARRSSSNRLETGYRDVLCPLRMLCLLELPVGGVVNWHAGYVATTLAAALALPDESPREIQRRPRRVHDDRRRPLGQRARCHLTPLFSRRRSRPTSTSWALKKSPMTSFIGRGSWQTHRQRHVVVTAAGRPCIIAPGGAQATGIRRWETALYGATAPALGRQQRRSLVAVGDARGADSVGGSRP